MLLAGLVLPGHAQENDGAAALPAIDVTDVRPGSQAPVFHTPASASVLDGSELEETRQDTLGDVVQRLPGTSVSSYTQANPIVMIRGLGIESDESDSSSVAVLLDGVPLPPLAVGQLFDLDQVQLLRGPQLLHGPGAMGGMILLQSRDAQPLAAGDLTLEGGNYGHRRAVLRGDVPLFPGSALRLAAGGEHSDGYTHNSALARSDTARWRNAFARLKWRHQDAGGGQWHLGLHQMRSHGGNDWFAPTRLARQHHSEASDAGLNRTDMQLLSARHQRVLGGGAHFSAVVGSSRTQWSYWMPESLLPGRTGFDMVTRQHSMEARIGGQNATHDWLLGGFGQYTRRDAPYLFDMRPFWFSRTQAARAGHTLAAFGELGWKGSGMAQDWRLAAALRLEHTRQRLTWNAGQSGLLDTDGDGLPDTPFRADAEVPRASLRQHTALPRATLEYRPGAQHFGWLSLARGHAPAGFNTYATTQEQAAQPYRQATARHLELGWRQRTGEGRGQTWGQMWRQTWEWSATLYDTALRAQHHVRPFQGQTVTTNVPRSRIRGAELAGQWRPQKTLELRAFWGWTRARYGTYVVDGVDYTGAALPMTPRHSAGGTVLWQPGAQWRAGLSLTRRGATWLFPDSRSRSPAHTLVDAHLTYRMQKWSLGLWGKNLGNAQYLTRALGNGLAVAGAPRTLGLRLTVDF